MKKYDSYKDSGIEWIGEIPSHWEVKKIKHFTNVLTGSTPKSTKEEYWNGNINWVTTDDLGKLKTKDIYNSRRKITNVGFVNSGTYIAPVGSIIISTRAPIGHLGVLRIEACTNQGCKTVISSSEFNSEFLYYLLYTSKEFLNSIGVGTTFLELPTQSLKDVLVPFPSLLIQLKIATYLDRKTAEIDELIADKKRLLELYEEEKTAIINQAVTKGINPDVPMRDSGIEWLGEIPEHWEVKKLRYLCKTTTGAKDTENREDDGKFPFFVRSQTIERISTFSFDGEGILTAGDGVGVCKVWHYVNEKFDFHQRVYLLYDFQEIFGKLLFYYIRQNFIHDVLRLSAKSTVDSLRRNMFLDFQVTFPLNIKEQQSIVHHIETECKRIDKQIKRTKKLIELLKEYRTALISEVVTGKIKVVE